MLAIVTAFANLGAPIATFIGAVLAGLVIISLGILATAICTGIFLQQVGTKVLGAEDYWCVENGVLLGAVFGLFFIIAAILQLGFISALLSLLGLCAALLFLALLVWCFAPQQKSARD
jgi:hypothetical protein